MTSAVLIIDVQEALASGEYKTHEVESVISRLNHVTNLARSKTVPVIFVQHEAKAGPLSLGAPGWDFAKGLDVLPEDCVISKRTADSFHQTELSAKLSDLGVEHLLIGGIQSDFCVDTSVRRALALGFEVSLLADGHTTLGNGVLSAEQIISHHNKTLSSISSFGPRVELVTSFEVRFGVA